MRRQVLWPLFGLLLFGLLLFGLLPASAAVAGDFRIVPGQRIGGVVLGMGRASVHARLRAPSASRRLPDGLVVDTWLGHQLLTTDPNSSRRLKRDYLTVFFRRGRAVQIEASAARFTTANGLSAGRSPNAFAEQYPHYRQPHRRRYAPGPDGLGPYEYGPVSEDASSPAGKHFLLYGDAVPQGIAWKYGAWGNLAPEPDPDGPLEAVIVHKPGQIVLLNPNDGLPYAGTGPARKSLDE